MTGARTAVREMWNSWLWQSKKILGRHAVYGRKTLKFTLKVGHCGLDSSSSEHVRWVSCSVHDNAALFSRRICGLADCIYLLVQGFAHGGETPCWLASMWAVMYTRVNKNPSAWNFLSPKPEVTCGTVTIIIRVVLLSPYLRIRAVSMSSIHYNQSHRVYINRRRQYICLIWN